MYRREGLPYKLLLAVADLVVLSVAFWAAYALRFGFPEVLPFDHLPSLQDTLITFGLSLASFLVVFRARGLYDMREKRSGFDEFAQIVAAILLSFLVLISLSYFAREDRYSRLTLGLFGFFALVVMGVTRNRLRVLVRAFVHRRVAPRRTLIFGAGELARKVADALLATPELGREVVGFLGDESVDLQRPVLGPYERAAELVQKRDVDEVLFALPLEEHARLPDLLDLVSGEAVEVKVVPDLYRYVTLCAGVEEFGGLPIIRLQGTPMSAFDRFLKRAFDAGVSALLLLLASPLLLLIALAVRLTSRGPILYRQERMGLDGCVFEMIKFRTMHHNAEAVSGKVWARPNDPRCTALGGVLRRLSLDELPQLFNVLRGDMSLVGPRPERPVFIEKFRERVPGYQLRHMVKAGLTGWAQVNGWRGFTSIEKRLEYDLYYIEHWSFGLDLRILLRTLAGGFLHKGG